MLRSIDLVGISLKKKRGQIFKSKKKRDNMCMMVVQNGVKLLSFYTSNVQTQKSVCKREWNQ